MNILVINSGSSSLKFKLIDIKLNKIFHEGFIDRIGQNKCSFKFDSNIQNVTIKSHSEAIKFVFDKIKAVKIDAVGHRVVHGGDKYNKAIIINDKVISDIQALSDLAPLHNPINLIGIKAILDLFPNLPQVAVFDTAFHQSIKEDKYSYAIPYKLATKHKIRKYGFHGTSHKYLYEKTKQILGKKSISAIICHLGNGSSISVIHDGKVIDTSMGFTPLQGLIMGTRSGDIDSEIIPYLIKKEGKNISEIMHTLNKESGLLGISGHLDMRDIFASSLKGDLLCIKAIDMYSYKVAFYIAGYMATLKKLPDAIVFSAGIGQGAYYIRKKVCGYLKYLGVELNHKVNDVSWINSETLISLKTSKIKIYVIPTDEEYMIASETNKILKKNKFKL
jgi:acetate kinase